MPDVASSEWLGWLRVEHPLHKFGLLRPDIASPRATLRRMDSKDPGIVSIILIPAIVTLVVTVLRLVGELQGWNDQVFSNVAPGGEQKPGFMGIAYLVPIFGFWFGFKLRRTTGQPPHIGKAALRFFIGAVVLIGGFAACIGLELITLPDKDSPGQPTGLVYSLIFIGVTAIILLSAWPKLAITLLLYGLLARIPVLIITYLAIDNGWDTHHVKLPVGTVLLDESERLAYLAMPQMTFWLIFTMLFGGLFGCLGAKLGSKRG